MTRSFVALAAMAVIATGCGTNDGRPHVSAEAADANATGISATPAPPAAAAVPSQEPAPATRTRTVERTRNAVPARSAPPRPAAYAPEASAPAAVPALPEYREIILPAGTAIALELRTELSSESSQAEDAVRAVLRRPLVLDGHRVLPAGTEFTGTVIDAQRSGRVKGRARVALQFTSLRHDSERHRVQTEPIEHIAEATKGEDATKVGVGAGAGAAIGALLGGGSGAAKGAVVGAAAGTGAVLATRGKEVHLEPGLEMTTRLAAPLTLRVPVAH